MTALVLAARCSGNVDIVKMLMRAGVDIEVKDNVSYWNNENERARSSKGAD